MESRALLSIGILASSLLFSLIDNFAGAGSLRYFVPIAVGAAVTTPALMARLRSSSRLVVLAVCAAALLVAFAIASACRSPFAPDYEYEEQLYLSVDGSARVTVDASLAALAALRGVAIDTSPRVDMWCVWPIPTIAASCLLTTLPPTRTRGSVAGTVPTLPSPPRDRLRPATNATPPHRGG